MKEQVTSKLAGIEAYRFAERIFPICRSITGDGVRETHNIIREFVPDLKTYEVPSGTKVFDWTVPDEWNIYEAWIRDDKGNIIVDFAENNLHIVGYSEPVDKWLTLNELMEYVYTEPEQPDWIPYVTSYYKRGWGFCISENCKRQLIEKYDENRRFHVYINSSFNSSGSLTYSEVIVPGASKKTILVSTYTCHPSMANNECSGPALAVQLIKWVKSAKRKYTYRFVFIPETIGSITYLSYNLESLQKDVIAGFNLSCVGDNRTYSFVETREGNTLVDRIIDNVLRYHSKGNYRRYSYLERGSDERQYNAPGVDLPVVGVTRSKYGEYPEYHTSADDMSIISEEGFSGSFELITKCFAVLEMNAKYKMKVLCEPQFGKRGLYPTVSKKGSYDSVKIMRDFIAYADGKRDLIELADKINVAVVDLIDIVEKLIENDLICEG